MYHKIRSNSTSCCVALQKYCTFFTKKRTFVCIKNRKRKAKALRLRCFSVSCCTAAGAQRFVILLPRRRCVLPYLLPRCGVAFCHISCCGWGAAFCHISCCGWGAAFCHISCCGCGCDTLRFAMLMPRCGCDTLRFVISLPRLGRCVLSDPCHAAVCHAPAPLSAAWLSGSTSNSVRASSPSSAPHTVSIAVKRFSGCA